MIDHYHYYNYAGCAETSADKTELMAVKALLSLLSVVSKKEKKTVDAAVYIIEDYPVSFHVHVCTWYIMVCNYGILWY